VANEKEADMQLGAVPQQRVTAKTVATGVTDTTDIDCAGADRLTVVWRLKATVTVGDLTVNLVRPYAADGTTLLNVVLPAASATAAAVGGSDVWAVSTYDLRGFQKVRLEAKNNNAGTLSLDIHTFTS
jgi:hypothetical protein